MLGVKESMLMPNGQTVHIQPQVQGEDWKILASRVLSFFKYIINCISVYTFLQFAEPLVQVFPSFKVSFTYRNHVNYLTWDSWDAL